MDDAVLANYLNDHLAGAEVGLRTAERLADRFEGEDEWFLRGMCAAIEEERDLLRGLLEKLGSDESALKRGVGALGGILGSVRDAIPIGDAPTLLEDLELLAIGVWGKRLLWGTLARVAVRDERFADIAVDWLAARAETQERRLLRIRADQLDRSLDLGDIVA
jgi:hypothetical protein